MSYSGANQARQARESLGHALGALQQDPNIPPEVMDVAQNIAQAVGALFQAERAAADTEGKHSVRAALGFLSQTLVLLQDVRHQHRGIEVATEAIAGVMGVLFPLTNVPSRLPPAAAAAPQVHIPQTAPIPLGQPAFQQPAFQPPPPSQPAYQQPAFQQPPAQQAYQQPQPAYQQPAAFTPPAAQPTFTQPTAQPAFTQPAAQLSQASQIAQAHAHHAASPQHAPAASMQGGALTALEANIGASTESNFYVGFSGEISDGGVFVATYESLPRGSPIQLLVTLPGGFEFRCQGFVRFVRDPMDFASDSEPGMGVQFAPHALSGDARGLIQRFIQKRAPIFYDE